MIPYGRQEIIRQDIDAVTEVLTGDFLTQGPTVPRFERAVADACDVPHAVAVNSATSALHIACVALGVGPGDVVWTTPITFVASSNCALYCGASVDFVDIHPRTYNIDVSRLREKLERVGREGGVLPKVVIPVHLCGQVAEMADIRALGDEFGFRIIEDASHAIGARYRGRPVGCCEFSDMTVFSFHPVKIITTAEGGMITTRDPSLAAHLARLRTHGITRDPAEMSKPSDGPWYYEQLELGYNYRLTDLQAALGLSQLDRLHAFVERRHAIARRYDELLSSLPLTLPWQHPDSYSGLHLYVIRLQLDKIRLTHRQTFDALRAADIGVNLHYIPIYRQPFYSRMGFDPREFPEAEQYYAEAISLPMFPALSNEEQDYICQTLTNICQA
jgi:UDP-4-amino-4,6-dideoxy-N-acetyl-beta-L-altrosamine transaminase